MPTFYSRALLTTTAAGATMLLAAGVASAHVTVSAPDAEQGGYSVLTFRVPTESETASTTKLTVVLPELNSARTEPMPGWQATVEKNADVKATSVTWTADPGSPGVPPGQFEQFLLSAGPLPDQESVSFAATQTYSDGEVVEWSQPMGDDGSEPEHPAPTLTLAAAGESSDGHSHGVEDTDASSEEASSTDTTARWLGGIGLVLGALGAVLGLGAYLRRAK
ncbi:MAG TPA: YcnI family protein [Aldersonia sp.]